MIYRYDGSVNGFFTAIFYGYPFLETLDIQREGAQVSFLPDQRRIGTETDKAERVKRSLKVHFSPALYRKITEVFQSSEADKDRVLAVVIHRLYREGEAFLSSLHPAALHFQRYHKRIRRELHRYKGFLRLKELDNGYLLGEFEPENDLLPLIVPHFIRRLPKESFILYDRGRGYCALYRGGELGFFELRDLHIDESEKEAFFQAAWREFYDAITIDERKNRRRMMSNMPKKYWKYLPEKR